MKWGKCFAVALVAVFASASLASAQVRADSARTDSTRRPGAPVLDTTIKVQKTPVDSAAVLRAQVRRDSIAKFRAGDTLKSPMARFETPTSFEIDDKLRFNRDQILSSEANNLSELLERVPGVTSFATGWLASVHVSAYLGDFAHVRVFMDGVEMDANNPRSNGVLDLSNVYLWMLDEIVIERAAGEVRVWCRSSTTTRTTAYTRTDIYTGDLNTNGFRGIFARRYRNGFALQFSGSQFATQQGRATLSSVSGTAGRGNGGNQTLSARTGWSNKKLSVDVYGVITTRDRDSQSGVDTSIKVPAFRGARREGYLRLGYGDTTGGLWSQILLNALRTRLEGIRATVDDDSTQKSDTTLATTQKVFAVGYTTKKAQLSFTDRLRTFGGSSYNAPAVRAAYSGGGSLSGGVFIEKSPLDSSKHVDAALRFAPRNWFTLAFNETVRTYDETTGRNTEQIARVDAGLRYHKLWLLGGVIKQTASAQTTPGEIVGNTGLFALYRSKGATFGAQGNLYKALSLNVQGIFWADDTLRAHRPRMNVRSDLGLQTNWLSRFPKGQFGINAHLINEIRSPIVFNYATAKPDSVVQIKSIAAQIFTGLLEIRIQRAVLFYQFHNISGQAYELVPGIAMPRQIQLYGVRWEFWN